MTQDQTGGANSLRISIANGAWARRKKMDRILQDRSGMKRSCRLPAWAPIGAMTQDHTGENTITSLATLRDPPTQLAEASRQTLLWMRTIKAKRSGNSVLTLRQKQMHASAETSSRTGRGRTAISMTVARLH